MLQDGSPLAADPTKHDEYLALKASNLAGVTSVREAVNQQISSEPTSYIETACGPATCWKLNA